MSSNSVDEWNLVKEQFEALVRARPDNIEDLFDAEFQNRFSQLIIRAAIRENRTSRSAQFPDRFCLSDSSRSAL
jgi:hypothetical protein